ncbi:MAG: mandelate racemase/muconate lactonizing enzyme family protein [Rhodospirillaceae bacterium]
MKIKSISTRIVRLPYEEPLAGGPTPAGATKDFVTLTMQTEDGIEGIGVTFFGSALTATLKHAIDQLGALIIGDDPLRTEAIVNKLRAAAGTTGPGGVFTLALSAIDIALWDIKGKALDLPVSALCGGYRDRAPTYASGALMREFPVEHLEKAAPKLVERGFRQMKTQMGGEAYPAREVERIRRIRESIGEEIDLMCDINQKWTVQTAISVGQQVEQYHLYWLEDVTAHDDYPGLARVAEALATPIAAGEYVYGIVPFRHMMEARSVDIVMIDLVRVGGITQWRKVAGMAEAFNLPVVSHLLPEIHVHLIAAIPNGLTVEYMPWSLRLYEETPKIEKGMIVVPQKPGLGLKFDEDVLKRYGC